MCHDASAVAALEVYQRDLKATYSAVEAAIDRHGDEFNELSGRAKDLGSAAVMLSLMLVAALWASFAWQRFA